jgi:hypothetical protein
MPYDPAVVGLAGTVVGGIIGVAGSYLSGRLAAGTARIVAFQGWRREVQWRAFDSASAAVEVARRLFSLRRPPTPEEKLEFSSGIIPPLVRGRVAFGLETSQEAMQELTIAVASVLTVLDDGRADREPANRLNLAVSGHSREITEAWQRTLSGRTNERRESRLRKWMQGLRGRV